MKRTDLAGFVRDGAWGRLQGLRHGIQVLLEELNQIHEMFGIPRWNIDAAEGSIGPIAQTLPEEDTIVPELPESGKPKRRITKAARRSWTKQAENMRNKLRAMQREYKRLGGTGPVSRAKLEALKAKAAKKSAQ